VRIQVKIEIESPICIEIGSMSKREKPKDRLGEREEPTTTKACLLGVAHH
jgi:hypothetical protein